MNVMIERDDGIVESHWGVTDFNKHIEGGIWLLRVSGRSKPIRIDGELKQAISRFHINQPGVDEIIGEQKRRDEYEVHVHGDFREFDTTLEDHVTEDNDE